MICAPGGRTYRRPHDPLPGRVTGPTVRRRAIAEVRAEVAGTREVLSGRDVAGAAATLTYFAGIALVAWLLVALWTTSWFAGADGAARRWRDLAVLVPPDMGARPSYDLLVTAGTHVGLLGGLVLLFPASFYGEGVRRACLAIVPQPDTFTGWRARLAMTALVVVAPLVAWVFLLVGELMAPLSPEGGGGGLGDHLVRILVAFTTVWLALGLVLTWVFRMVAPGRPRWAVAAVGALATGSFLAGFLQGFTLFLSLPVDVGLPFAGLGVVGGVVAVGLWLYVLHLFLLVGWAATCALDHRVREGRP